VKTEEGAMTVTAVDVTGAAGLTHDEAMALLATELERTLGLLSSLEPDDWSTRTDCPDWDVHQMYLHVLGACEASASMKQNLQQMRAARRHQKANGGPLEASLSAVQVADRSLLGAEELLERLRAIAPVTVRKRTKLPGLLRRATVNVDGPVVERWSLGYLIDTIYLRDLWMHRVDASRATGRALELTADHDGHLVADVVAEWARRHRRPFTLTLTGPAGGEFTGRGADGEGGGEVLRLDAVEFCRVLSGRAPADGLLATIVPF
jgi:uncharacterized protein (TIGR03083 family)